MSRCKLNERRRARRKARKTRGRRNAVPRPGGAIVGRNGGSGSSMWARLATAERHYARLGVGGHAAAIYAAGAGL